MGVFGIRQKVDSKARNIGSNIKQMKRLAHVVVAASVLFGCGSDNTQSLKAGATVVDPNEPRTPESDFRLLDVNTASPTYNTEVSPRDYIGKVSGWYFGRAT